MERTYTLYFQSMTNFQSDNWKLFASRPASILKRDFMKWCYLAVENIPGLQLTKSLVIGNNQEIDVFVDRKEHEKNFSYVLKQYKKVRATELLNKFHRLCRDYRPYGRDAVKRSFSAMKNIGPIILYTYYIEEILEKTLTQRATK